MAGACGVSESLASDIQSPRPPSPENRGWLLLLIPFTKLKMSARLHSMRPSSTSELTITTSDLLL
ncbi:hypothetical protein DM062_07715 [Klebsiella pneumoniae]|nr:hypothetical protein DM062_07715 [Klebsiella pneumoniae]